jgi:hypothetical protein
MFFNLNSTGVDSCSDAALELVRALIDYGFVEKFSDITEAAPNQTIQVAKNPPEDPGLHPISVSVLSFLEIRNGGTYTLVTATDRAQQLFPAAPPYAETEDLILNGSSASVNVTLECPESMAINGKKWRIKISSIGEALTQTFIPPLDYEGQTPVYSSRNVYNSAGSTGYSLTAPTGDYGFNRWGGPIGRFSILFSVSYHTGYSLTITHNYYLPPSSVTVIVGTENNLPDDGSIIYDSLPAATTQQALRPTLVHPLGGLSSANWGNFANDIIRASNNSILYNAINPADISKYFYSSYFVGNTSLTSGRIKHYTCVTITDRGVFFGIWNNESQDTGKYFSWFLIQYPVMKNNGVVRGRSEDTSDSLTPVFCVFSSPVASTYLPTYGKIIVRERDISVPSKVYRPTITRGTDGSIISIVDEEDHPSFINPHKQVCFDENGNYVATFLSDLTTRRYFYPDELDMVATVSSDLVGFGQELQFTVYGEAEPRTYVALNANAPGNTGMRILVLKNNPNPPDTP